MTTAYDGFGRVTSSTPAMAGTSRTIGHLYDAEGNRVRITHPDGSFFTYEYDGLERFVRVRENGADIVANFAYDPAGRRSGLTSGGTASSFGYDSAGRLSSLTHNLAGTAGDQVIGLGYNPASQIQTRTGSNDAYAWAGSVALNRPYSVNGQNQYLTAGPASFAYDANGNLTSDGSTSFVYDVENRLVSASGAKNASLVYDPLGRLFQTSGGASGVTQFLYDDDALIGEYDSGGYMLHRYVHGPAKGVDDPLIWYHNAASGWRRALVSDQQGSIVAVADMYGNPVAINSYDEYGIPGAGNQGRFQYTGQAWIPELGMYYYKARIYSPTLGRFMQVDPIGYEDQVNLYAYVGNDPINGVDPDGQERCLFICRLFGGSVPIRGASGRPVGRYNREAGRSGVIIAAGAAGAQGAVLTTTIAGTALVAGWQAVAATAVNGGSTAFRGAERVVASGRTTGAGTAESAMARAANPLAGTRPLVEAPGRAAQGAKAMADAVSKIGRPDQVGLKGSPVTTTQKAINTVARLADVARKMAESIGRSPP